MSDSVNGTRGELVVVHVKDAINSILTGRGDVDYQSPPLPAEEAMTLVRLLLGRGGAPAKDEISWRCPIAGGQRTVTIQPLRGRATPGRGGQPAMQPYDEQRRAPDRHH